MPKLLRDAAGIARHATRPGLYRRRNLAASQPDRAARMDVEGGSPGRAPDAFNHWFQLDTACDLFRVNAPFHSSLSAGGSNRDG